jgi:hypothetical protein
MGTAGKNSFDVVRTVARALPDIEEATAWGAHALKARGKLLACEAIHKSAEPDSLVVKVSFDQRVELIRGDPAVYYLTDHYVNFPSVLVRLRRIHRDSLRDLLGMSWRFVTEGRAPKRRARKRARKERIGQDAGDVR